MKTIKHLKTLATSSGGTLVEGHGFRDMRTFNLEAPEGKMWVDGYCSSFRVEWARGTTPSALKHNDAAFADVKERVEAGTEEEPSEEEL